MTKFKGVLLFDMPEPAIGDWENQLGYRGMIEVWKHKKTGDELIIEPCDEGYTEVLIHNKDHTKMDSLNAFDTDQEADDFAKKWMREHLEGWI